MADLEAEIVKLHDPAKSNDHLCLDTHSLMNLPQAAILVNKEVVPDNFEAPPPENL